MKQDVLREWNSYFVEDYLVLLEMEPTTFIKNLIYNFHAILSKIDKSFIYSILKVLNQKNFSNSNYTYCFVSILKYARKVNLLTYDEGKKIFMLDGY